jgi:hypothetical protein
MVEGIGNIATVMFSINRREEAVIKHAARSKHSLRKV